MSQAPLAASDLAVSWWQVIVATGVPLGASAALWVVRTIRKAESNLTKHLRSQDQKLGKVEREAALAGRAARAAHRRLDQMGAPDRRQWPTVR